MRQIMAEGGFCEDGGDCLKYVNRGWNRKERGRNQEEGASWVNGWLLLCILKYTVHFWVEPKKIAN